MSKGPMPEPHTLAAMDQHYARTVDSFANFVALTAELLADYGGNKALVAAIVRTRIDMSWGDDVARALATVGLVEWAATVLRAAADVKARQQ